MRSINSGKVLLVCSTLAILAFSCRACAGDRVSDLINNLTIGAMVKKLDTSIHFYGRVVDQNGDPVEGARVAVGIRRFSLFGPFFMGSKNLRAFTDREGHFDVWELRGSQLFIGEISREGYEFIRNENRNNDFTFKGLPGEPVFIPDKNDPVIFRLRKKQEDRTFLIEEPRGGVQVHAEDSGVLKGKDLIEGKGFRVPEGEPESHFSENCDLWYRAIFDEETGDWRVFLKSAGLGGGIFASDHSLYVAPDGGYLEEYSFVPVGREIPVDKFLYIRSRTPAIFTRLEIYSVVVTDGFVRIRWKSATNPYGERVLDSVDMESLSSKQWLKLKTRLKSEAQAALREGRLPERPKIMALIEAAKRGED